MPINITVKKPQNPQMAISRANAEAKKHKLFFTGDERSGRGSGYGFDVSYTAASDKVTFTVHKKPIVFSKTKIVKKFNEFWANYLEMEG